MAQDINQDNFGNTYFNYWDALTNGFVGHQLGGVFNNFLQAAFGTGRWAAGNPSSPSFERWFAFTPNNSDESISSATTGSLFRFYADLMSNAHDVAAIVNSNTGNSLTSVSLNGGFVNYIPNENTDYFYAVANNRSLVMGVIKRDISTGGFDPTNWRLLYLGWLKNPGFGFSLRTRNCSALHYTYGTGNGPAALSGVAFRPAQENQITPSSYGISNYSITCTNSTPNPSTTDLVLRDSVSPNFAIGSCYNLLKSSANVDVGKIYDIPNLVDGNNEQRRFLCVGNWGSEKLLMRIWTEGF